MERNETASRPREWRGVQFSQDNVAQFDGGRIAIAIPREEIEKITLRNGPQAQQPMVQLIIGLALALGSLIPLCKFLLWMIRDGIIVGTGMVVLGVVFVTGAGIMFRALRRGFYLEVQHPGGLTKLMFRGRVPLERLMEFLKSVEERFGYQIDRPLPGAGFPVKAAQ